MHAFVNVLTIECMLIFVLTLRVHAYLCIISWVLVYLCIVSVVLCAQCDIMIATQRTMTSSACLDDCETKPELLVIPSYGTRGCHRLPCLHPCCVHPITLLWGNCNCDFVSAVKSLLFIAQFSGFFLRGHIGLGNWFLPGRSMLMQRVDKSEIKSGQLHFKIFKFMFLN